MAEFVMKDMVEKLGLSDKYYIRSSATSSEALGFSVHKGTRDKLAKVGISVEGKHSEKLQYSDLDKYDYFFGMNNANIIDMRNILGKTPKIMRLLDLSENPREIADPWYTGNFDKTYDDIIDGCNSLLKFLKEKD
jgi:protein-tyrosine phosphatase